MNDNGPRWDRVAMVALIMIFVVFAVYVGADMLEEALGPIGKPLFWVFVLVIVAAVGLGASQLLGVAFYKTGVQHGTVATTQGIDAAVDALTSDNELDIKKLNVLLAAMKPHQQAALTDEKLRLEAEKWGIKLEGKNAEQKLRLDYNEQSRAQREMWRREEAQEREARQQEEQKQYQGFDDADDEEIEFDQYSNAGFWNGSE